jgi:Killing trait
MSEGSKSERKETHKPENDNQKVNEQVSDAVAQAGVSVIGSSPAISPAFTMISTSQALCNAAYGATFEQKNSILTSLAMTSKSVKNIMGENRMNSQKRRKSAGANNSNGPVVSNNYKDQVEAAKNLINRENVVISWKENITQ